MPITNLLCWNHRIRFLYFHFCFAVFTSCVQYCGRHGSCLSHTHQSLSFHTWTTVSPPLHNKNCLFFFSSGLLPVLGQVECSLLALIVTQTLNLLSINVSANITQLQKCFGRCNDSSLNFCLKVITLCPPNSSTQLHTSPCYTYNLILPHTPFSPALHVLLFSLDCKW